MDGADVRVVQSGGGLGFTEEALLGLSIIEQMSREKLEGDVSSAFHTSPIMSP